MKTRHLVIAVVLFALLAGSAAFAQTLPQYTRQFGSDTYDHANKIVADPSGNVYVAGYTHGVINAPSRPGANTSAGGKDAFVAKFDPQGALLWVTQFGSTGDDSVEGIFLHNLFGTLTLYVAGSTNGSMPGGPQRGMNPLAGGVDLFAAKIDPSSGTISWVRQYGTAGDDIAYGLVADQNAMIYVVGSTTGRLDGVTEPGATRDAFLLKLNASGDWMEINQFNIASNPLDTEAYAVAIESLSNPSLFVTGRVQGNEEGSLFVAKFDTHLNPASLGQSVVTLGGRNKGSDSDTGWAIAVDQSGNVIVAGSTKGAFEGNASAGGDDIVVVKLTARLATVWTHQYGTDALDAARGVAVDAEGSIYVTGVTGFPSGPGLDGQAHRGDYDIFLTRFAPDGRKIYTRQVGTEARDWADGIAVDPAGNVYLAGATEGALVNQNFGLWDAVLIKYGSDGPVPPPPPAPRPVTDFFINGIVRELPSGSPLSAVTITVKDWGGNEVASGSTGTSGQFGWQVPAAGRYSIHKLKIGYTAQVDPEVVEVTAEAPTATLVSTMQKIVVKTQMSFRKGYNTVRFTKLPSGDKSVNTVFGQYAGNPYVGLLFSFDRPMQYLLLSGGRTVGNLKALEFGRSYMMYTSRAFVLDTTDWVGADTAPPATTYRGRVQY
jgi:hypothetical protein